MAHRHLPPAAAAGLGTLANREDGAFAEPQLDDVHAALLARPAELDAMRVAARGFGRPGAANAVADLVMALAERRPLPSADAIERVSRAAA